MTLRMPSAFPVTMLLLIVGLDMIGSVHGVSFQHKKCLQKNVRFPNTVMINLNITRLAPNMYPDVRTRSLSPWDIRLDIDANRYPSVIAEAKCHHKACVDAQGNIDINLNSTEIKQEILILRRELKGCNYVFKLEKKMVAVGCTCVRHIQH